jgi:predicted GIY-YIG superfamily endonuclease
MRTDWQLREHNDLHEILAPLINSGGAVFAVVYTLSTEEWTQDSDRTTTRLLKLMTKNYNFRESKVYWCLRLLKECGALRGFEENIGKQFKKKDRLPKKTTPKTCGIYGIFEGKNVYVGLSSDIEKRFVAHKTQLERGTHPYSKCFSEVKNLEFKIIKEYKKSQLEKKEPLHAQVLATKGYNVVNSNNFNLILEDK